MSSDRVHMNIRLGKTAAALVIMAGAAIAGSCAQGPTSSVGARSATPPRHHDDWRASTFSISSQSQTDVAVAERGEIVAAWSSRRQQDGRYGVYAQRFTSQGVAIGSETPLGLWGESHQLAPALASDPTGGIWAAWVSHGQDGDGGSIIARHLSCEFDGGSEILVNESWQGHQADPVIAVAPTGRALLAWTSSPGMNRSAKILVRLFGTDGEPISREIHVADVDGRYENVPSAAAASDGTFAVVFGVFDEHMKPVGIRMQRLDTDGRRLGREINVSGSVKHSQIEPVISAAPDGWIVAWLDAESDGSDYGVIAQRLDRDGAAIGEPFIVNTTTDGLQNGPAVAVARDGAFTIAWNGSDDDKAGVFAQRFAADGSRIGGEFRLTDRSEGAQRMRIAAGTRRLVYAADGSLICAWSGDAGGTDGSSANITLISREPVALGEGVQRGVTTTMEPAGYAMSDHAKPHIPPTFNPQEIQEGEREIRTGRGDFGFTGIFNSGWNPPDPHLAVGPNHLVAIVNGTIAFFTKDGSQTFQDEIEDSFGFWGSVGATGFVFDPEVLYDELSGRFFAMAAEGYAPGDRSYALIAVSDDSDPNGTWHKYRFETTSLAGYIFDSPNIAVDADVLYITGDGFGLGANYPVFTFDKASLLAGDPPAVSRSTTLPTSTQSAGIPPVSFDNPPALYMIEHKELYSNSSVKLIALTDPLGSISFTTYTLTVPTYNRPGNPPQQGTSSRPELFDGRFWSCAYRNGSLWATHHAGSNPVSARWYEIAMNGWPDSGSDPTLVQSGVIDEGSDIHLFFTSITVDDAGNAALCFARSATTEYISMATTYRAADDPLGTMRPMVIQQTSNAPRTGERWGDYSQVNVDPADGRTFWAHHEYSINNSWRTWIAAFAPPQPDIPGDLNGDGCVDQADLGQLLSSYLHNDGGDIDGDGDTDQADLGLLLSHYLEGC